MRAKAYYEPRFCYWFAYREPFAWFRRYVLVTRTVGGGETPEAAYADLVRRLAPTPSGPRPVSFDENGVRIKAESDDDE